MIAEESLDRDGLELLCHTLSSTDASLEFLGLEEAKIDLQMLHKIVDTVKTINLRGLSLRRNDLDAQCQMIVGDLLKSDSAGFGGLKVLDLSDNDLNLGMQYIMEAVNEAAPLVVLTMQVQT